VGTPPMALIKAGLLKGINPSLTVGVRAENISIAKSSDSLFECTISEIEFLGSETQIGLEHNGITGLTVTVPGVSTKCVGEQLHITFNEKDLHYFNEAGDLVASP
jgi:sn-glycerol 3-phosphate transport system ATP-binding protein